MEHKKQTFTAQTGATHRAPALSTVCCLLTAVCCLLTAASASAEGLAFKWRTEVSSAAPYDAQAMQGESFTLEATLVQYGQPMAGEATATFYYQTKDMEKHQWYTAPAAWASATGTVSATWTPAMDVGTTAYRWFFGIDTAQGHNYRAYGTLRLKPSPGFSPALLEPIDLREQLKAELYAQLQADLSAAFAADLQAEAQAREEADSAITQAVNAQAGVLEQHQGYLSTLSSNFNALYSSYTNTVSELQATDAAHESALATKAALEHTHAIADTEGLQTALNAKADESAVLLADPIIVPPPTGTDRANFFGWVGTLADWGLSGEALDLRVVTLTRRNNAGGVNNATFYARIVHVGESGEIEVLFQSIGAINWSTIAYNASCSFSLSHLPGAPYPSATERVALYFVTDPAAPAWKSVGTFGLTVQLNAPGGIANEPTSQTSLPGGQAYRPILGWAYTDLAATLEGRLALLNNTKAAATHTHAIADTTGLQAALDGKAALEHTHSQYLTTESDPTVSAWAKAATKPTYTWTEILNRPATWDWANLTNKPTAFTPAEHNHDGTYLKLTGGTVTGNVTFKGTSNYMEKLEFGGSAGAAGLMTRGISGRTYSNSPGGAKDSLFLNYDGSTISHSTYWNYGNDASRGVFVCGGAPGGLVVRRIDLETILKDYSPAAHTHAIADTTGLQAALEALAPLSSVTCTTNAVTYIWQWDEEAGTFALVEQ